MDHLKVQVGKMHDLDRHCVLLLDEISLLCGLHYERHKGHISGYEDLGHLGRSENVADHALNSRMKMKIKEAAAQLSYSVTACIETWVASGNLPSEAVHIAGFVHKVGLLFDALNGYSFSVPEGEPLKGVLKILV
ncbi:hypothetical protein HHI36_016886 [Cryptolaemus montrouzieri]|uniref:Transposable element P transposase-like RNase H domain-containing protein n=1 Tax=Cryptolaemus montrouzieri TaxID=559131 RepID=A0ABD2NKV3_9CUCU